MEMKANENVSEMERLLDQMEKIYGLLGQLVKYVRPSAPNYRYQLEAYWGFDWEGLGGAVLREDADGVSVVQWGGYAWTRRSGDGKFGETIWFSRADGKDEAGNNRYLRLVTFKAMGEPERVKAGVMGNRPEISRNTPVVGQAVTRFDVMFLAAHPEWEKVGHVAQIRGLLGAYETEEKLRAGLVAYKAAFDAKKEVMSRAEAHVEALEEGRKQASMRYEV